MSTPAAEPAESPLDTLNREWVAQLWAKGHDTYDIARIAVLSEAQVCRILARLQDERHAARTSSTGAEHGNR